jgi:NifU-like domain
MRNCLYATTTALLSSSILSVEAFHITPPFLTRSSSTSSSSSSSRTSSNTFLQTIVSPFDESNTDSNSATTTTTTTTATNALSKKDDGPLDLTWENVEMVLDEMRPFLIQDGGNVAITEIDGPVVRLELQVCRHCRSFKGSCLFLT